MAALRDGAPVAGRTDENDKGGRDGDSDDEGGPTAGKASNGTFDQQNVILRAIEGEILPRLFIAHGGMQADRTCLPTFDQEFDAALVGTFANLLTRGDEEAVDAFVETQMANGLSVESLFLDLFAPTARELGDMWLRDDCSFSEVTIGLCALECQLMRRSEPSQSLVMSGDEDRMALFSPVPGEQHVFGLLIVKELFRRAGWSVAAPRGTDAESLLDAVQERAYTMVGLSVGRVEAIEECGCLIPKIRAVSRNSDVVIVVGGHCLDSQELVDSLTGADLIVADGPAALAQIERMVGRPGGKYLVN